MTKYTISNNDYVIPVSYWTEVDYSWCSTSPFLNGSNEKSASFLVSLSPCQSPKRDHTVPSPPHPIYP